MTAFADSARVRGLALAGASPSTVECAVTQPEAAGFDLLEPSRHDGPRPATEAGESQGEAFLGENRSER